MKVLSVFLLLSGSLAYENGISTLGLTNDIIRKYDVDKNGELDVTDESFLRTELLRENGKDVIIKTESRGLLFTDADAAGERNNVASAKELQDLIETFDEDGNAEITNGNSIFEWLFMGKTEWGKFDAKYGEKFSYKAQ